MKLSVGVAIRVTKSKFRSCPMESKQIFDPQSGEISKGADGSQSASPREPTDSMEVKFQLVSSATPRI